MGHVVVGEDQRFGKTLVLELVLQTISFDFFKDLSVRVRRSDLVLDLRGVKHTLVLDEI